MQRKLMTALTILFLNAAFLAGGTDAATIKTIGGGDFQPTDSNLAYTNQGGSIFITTLEPGFGVRKWLDLPQGAVVSNVTFFYLDNSAVGGLSFMVQAYNPQDGIIQPLATGETIALPDSTSIRQFSIDTDFTIDNSQNAYALRVGFDDASINLRLLGARVTYTVPTVFLPTVLK